jgi:hypothetical protein
MPLRDAPLFGATDKLTVPLPEPELPDEIEMKLTLLVALQEHPLGAVTVSVSDPVPEVKKSAGLIVIGILARS